MSQDPKSVVIDYTNWRGQRAERTIIPDKLVFGHNAFHKDEQWLLLAEDQEKGEMRMFAVAQIHAWKAPQRSEKGGENPSEESGL